MAVAKIGSEVRGERPAFGFKAAMQAWQMIRIGGAQCCAGASGRGQRLWTLNKFVTSVDGVDMLRKADR